MARTIPRDSTGLSPLYRLGWRIKYVLITFMGPADLDGEQDPRARMRSERWERVNDAREARGESPLEPDR